MQVEDLGNEDVFHGHSDSEDSDDERVTLPPVAQHGFLPLAAAPTSPLYFGIRTEAGSGLTGSNNLQVRNAHSAGAAGCSTTPTPIAAPRRMTSTPIAKQNYPIRSLEFFGKEISANPGNVKVDQDVTEAVKVFKTPTPFARICDIVSNFVNKPTTSQWVVVSCLTMILLFLIILLYYVIAATTVTAFVSGFLIGVLCMLMNMPKQIQAFEDEAQLKINEDNNRSGIEAMKLACQHKEQLKKLQCEHEELKMQSLLNVAQLSKEESDNLWRHELEAFTTKTSNDELKTKLKEETKREKNKLRVQADENKQKNELAKVESGNTKVIELAKLKVKAIQETEATKRVIQQQAEGGRRSTGRANNGNADGNAADNGDMEFMENDGEESEITESGVYETEA